MISERTLKTWRKDALITIKKLPANLNTIKEMQQAEIILKLTQELMDNFLVRKGGK